MARLCKNLFEKVAPTLEKLSCYGRFLPEDCVILFPRLRTLWLNASTMTSDQALEGFFPADTKRCALRSIAANGTFGAAGRIWKFLARRGHIPGLEVLNPTVVGFEEQYVFLSANPQLKSLLIESSIPETLTKRFLPFLASNLKFLTSLVITLRLDNIPSTILAEIGRILSLTSLWIAALDCGWRGKWIIDNPPSIAALSPLRNLTRLALSEGNKSIEPEVQRGKFRLAHYKQISPESHRSWEDWHNERVRKVVESYVAEVGSLRWVYMGQLVHTVVGDEVVLMEGGMKLKFPDKTWGYSF